MADQIDVSPPETLMSYEDPLFVGANPTNRADQPQVDAPFSQFKVCKSSMRRLLCVEFYGLVLKLTAF